MLVLSDTLAEHLLCAWMNVAVSLLSHKPDQDIVSVTLS